MFQDLHWELVNSKTINAFTTGGHYVYIYNALFQMCKNEDELAAVMAHEYGHIYCRHVQKGTGRQEALAMVSLAATGAGYVYGGQANGAQYAQAASSLTQAGGGFIDMGFTRGDEAQADEYGLRFYTRAGWPPEHFADFFKDMIAAGYDKTPAIASDHPTLASRVEAAEKRVKALDPARVAQLRKDNIATQEQFNQYKRAAVGASQGMPDDQKVLQAKNLLQALPRSCWVPYVPDDQKEAAEAHRAGAETTTGAERGGDPTMIIRTQMTAKSAVSFGSRRLHGLKTRVTLNRHRGSLALFIFSGPMNCPGRTPTSALITVILLVSFATHARAQSADQNSPSNVACELQFKSSRDHKDPFNDLTLDVSFTDPSGTVRRVPAFWAGGNVWKARYASGVVGIHAYRTECSDAADAGLNGVGGKIEIVQYTGTNPLYLHGPIRIAGDHRHFEHADGTPFALDRGYVVDGVVEAIGFSR